MKTEINFESHELTVIRVRRSQTAALFCSYCAQKTTHFNVARAAAALGISETAIFRLVENGAVHSTETASGALFVCGNSVSNLAKGKKVIKGEK